MRSCEWVDKESERGQIKEVRGGGKKVALREKNNVRQLEGKRKGEFCFVNCSHVFSHLISNPS